MRATIKMLEVLAERITKASGTEHTIEQAYGGTMLCTRNGSVDALSTGHIPKSKLYVLSNAYLLGLNLEVTV
jgi:hypothetical protein